MSSLRMRPWHFLFLSTIILTVILSLHVLYELHKKHNILERELTEKVKELRGKEDEDEELIDLLDKAITEKKALDVEKQTIKERNRDLEEFFSSFLYTYDKAIAKEGHHMKVLSRSYFTAGMFEQAWHILGLPGMKGTGESLVQAERDTDMNAVVLACLAWLESGGGQSRLACSKNNLFGYGAYDGQAYRCGYAFATRGDGIRYVADQLRENYFSRGGCYYTGTTLVHANRYYASDVRWARKIALRMHALVKAAVDAEMVEILREGAL